MAATTRAVELDDIGVRVGATHILAGVNLDIDAGEAVGVFGSNGAGKTTLLRLLGTLLIPSKGTAKVFGTDLTSDGRYDIRPRIGYIGHTPALYPELTLAENLGFVAMARGVERDAVYTSLEAVGLARAADRRAEVCSHGMQRRAEFARVIMLDHDLLLLDEPHSSLDGDAVDLVDALVRRTVDRGGVAIMVSHDRDRVKNVADVCYEMSGGRIV